MEKWWRMQVFGIKLIISSGKQVYVLNQTESVCRIAVNYFVLGVEKYTENQQEEALELFTISYVVNEKLGEEPPNKDPPNPSNKVTRDQSR